MSKIGTADIKGIMLGSTEISKAYLGSDVVYKKRDDYIEWLKSLGCVCYLPLGSNGDLLDRISGKSLQLTGHGSFTWNTTSNAYRVTTSNTVYQYVAWLDNGMGASMFPDDCFTSVSTIIKVSTSGYAVMGHISPISKNSDTIAGLCPAYNGTGNATVYPSTAKIAVYKGTDERIYWQQGALYNTYAAHTPSLPSNWSTTSNGLAIGMVRMNDASYKSKVYGIKDVYIFNKKLTLEQIRKIQGYD